MDLSIKTCNGNVAKTIFSSVSEEIQNRSVVPLVTELRIIARGRKGLANGQSLQLAQLAHSCDNPRTTFKQDRNTEVSIEKAKFPLQSLTEDK